MLYVMSASYSPTLNATILKLYNDEAEKIEEWTDTTFKPYFLLKGPTVPNWKSIIRQERVQKYDAINDKTIDLWKLSMNTPLAIKNSRNYKNPEDVYENNIKFFQCYIYDNDIRMGMPYVREGGKLTFKEDAEAQLRIQNILSRFKDLSKEEQKTFEKWAMLLEYPAPDFKRAALDIEVFNKVENQIPNSTNALMPVITACIATNRGEKIAYVLIQEGKTIKKFPENVNEIKFFTDEAELLKALFKKINEYPIIVTFNGDDFDFRYLYYRALRFKIPKSKIPIITHKKICLLKHGLHIDLYKFFFIKAMRIYAFKAKYKNVDLDTVAKALIKKGKLKGDVEWVAEMSYHDLVRYCMNDAEITLELTTYDNNLVMNLIIILERMSRMPIENISRRSISSWIKSFMLYEHRQRNILIPNSDELKTLKGEIASMAVIKGKKYKGAVVFDPVTGTHFLVLVLDFASLYPSIIKVYNLGYSTINCPHEECKSNTIGELPHWMCTKHKSLESLLIGSLRDLRVFWYKKHAKPEGESDEKLRNWYSVAEQSIKVIMNASYGVFGAESFDLYCPPVAEEVTAIARHIITKTAAHAQKMGMEVLYGDTDSIFITKPSQELLDKLITWTQNEYGIEFEVDKEYRYACLSGRKKNYFGVKHNGDVDVKGLQGKKKHTPIIIRNAFDETKTILSAITTPEELTIGKQKIISLLKTIHSTFKNRTWKSIDELAFHVTMNSALEEYTKTTPQHVKAAKLLIMHGYEVGAGSIISFIKTNKKVSKGLTVKPVETTKRGEVDVTKYIEYLKSTFDQILDPMGISFEDDILGITRLEKWMHK